MKSIIFFILFFINLFANATLMNHDSMVAIVYLQITSENCHSSIPAETRAILKQAVNSQQGSSIFFISNKKCDDFNK